MKMNRLTVGSLGLLLAAAIAAGMATLSMGMSPTSLGRQHPSTATDKIAAGCNTCGWYGEYQTYAQAQSAANAHLAAHPGHDAGVLGR